MRPRSGWRFIFRLAVDFNKPDVNGWPLPFVRRESFRESAPIFKYSVPGRFGQERVGWEPWHRQSFSPSVLRLPRWSTKKARHPWNLLFIIFLIITQQATNSAGGCIQNLSAARQNAPFNLFYLPLRPPHLCPPTGHPRSLLPFFLLFLPPPPLSLAFSLSSLHTTSLHYRSCLSVRRGPSSCPLAFKRPIPYWTTFKGYSESKVRKWLGEKKKKQVDRVRHLFVCPTDLSGRRDSLKNSNPVQICSFLPLSSVYRSLVYRSMYRYVNFVENLYELITFRILESSNQSLICNFFFYIFKYSGNISKKFRITWSRFFRLL